MNYSNDKRIVLTLDAGGTNFVFSAIQGNKEVVNPVHLPAITNDINKCIEQLYSGFDSVLTQLKESPVAISFAFPGPADYSRGIIGDLPNFPAFKGGVALGDILNSYYNLPVYINNDGSLFAYGEALCGKLPEINQKLLENGNKKQYQNLLGVTLGTGFGGGVVINNQLLIGDNSHGGHLWILRNKKYNQCIVEESVSIRAVKRVYFELSKDDRSDLTPEDIYNIAEGSAEGDRKAAIKAFEELGEIAGNTIAEVLNLIDGLVVIGGGLTGAAKYILPTMVNEINSSISTLDGQSFPLSQSFCYNLEDGAQMDTFVKDDSVQISIIGTDRVTTYYPVQKTGIAISSIGASKAIALGAYAFALHQIDQEN